jgi:hypothetical protein
MKAIYISFIICFILLSNSNSLIAQTAIDFKVNDCSGNTKHLFGELDAGKIVVMSMVHPCASCVGPTKSAINIVNSFAASHPGRVVFYLTDDDGGTACNSLSSWANQYAISGVPIISNIAVNQSNFGEPGMPKIVMMAGTSHQILFNENNGLNATSLSNAISAALALTALPQQDVVSPFSIYPNPVKGQLNIEFNQANSGSVRIEITNMLGIPVLPQTTYQNEMGSSHITIDELSLANGFYLVKVYTNNQVFSSKIIYSN